MKIRTGWWARLLAALFALTLVAAACGNTDDDDGEAADTTAGGEGGGEPQPVPGFDGETIRLGAITAQTGLAAVIGNPLTNGNRVFFDALNAEGGIAGKYPVELEVVDSQYQEATAVQQYAATKNDVAAYVQILGTNVVNALLPQLRTDNIVASPASLDSFWIEEQQLLPLGAPYQIQAINAMDWWINEEGNVDSTVCLLRQDDEYGEAGKEGVEHAAEELDFEIAEEVTFAATDTQFGAQVSLLRAANCEVVVLVGLPTTTSPIMAAAEQADFAPQWIGMSPTWVGLFAGNSYMQEHLAIVLPGPQWGDEEYEGMAEMLADLEGYDTQEQQPDIYFAFGYAQAWAMAQVLEKAVERGDLSREGIVEASNELGTLSVGGILGDYEYGPPEEREFPRESWISVVDPSVPGGLRAVTEGFSSEAAESFELED